MAIETFGMSSHPVVYILQSVKADGYTTHTAADQVVKPFACETQAVAYHAPRVSPSGYFFAASFQIFTYGWLSTGDNDEYIVRIGMCCYAVQYF